MFEGLFDSVEKSLEMKLARRIFEIKAEVEL